MRQAHEFIGQHVMRANGRIWRHRTCDAPYVVVAQTKSINPHETYLRGLCAKCLIDGHIKFTDGIRPVEANWHTKLRMTRHEHWPAWVSIGVFDIE